MSFCSNENKKKNIFKLFVAINSSFVKIAIAELKEKELYVILNNWIFVSFISHHHYYYFGKPDLFRFIVLHGSILSMKRTKLKLIYSLIVLTLHTHSVYDVILI